jgi:ATP-binding protein involved in chromosome partitioning
MSDSPGASTRHSSQAGGGPAPHDVEANPRDLKVKIKEQRLVIEWQDGKRSDFSLAELRSVCPCATCRTQRSAQDSNPLKVLRVDPSGLRVTSAKLVGNYAIQFFWSDGHNTGIYDFRFLRSLGAA